MKKSNQNQSKIQQAKIQKTRNPKTIRILRNSPHETLQKNTPKNRALLKLQTKPRFENKVFFKKTKSWSFFVCERFENKKKGLLLMKKATKKGIKTLKSESVNINKNK